MDYDTYGSSAVELAIDLANAELNSPETFLTSHEEWFAPGTAMTLSGRDAGKVRENSQLTRALARPRPYATDHDGELHLHYASADSPALEQLTTTVAMGLSQVVVQHGWQRLGVCSAEHCDNVYVDTSRNASRRYCSNTCASRST